MNCLYSCVEDLHEIFACCCFPGFCRYCIEDVPELFECCCICMEDVPDIFECYECCIFCIQYHCIGGIHDCLERRGCSCCNWGYMMERRVFSQLHNSIVPGQFYSYFPIRWPQNIHLNPDFQRLTAISCSNCCVAFLPELPPLLEVLIVSSNFLEEIPALPATMRSLSCYSNPLKYLPNLDHTYLRHLDASETLLESVSDFPVTLTRLHLYSTNLMYLQKVPHNLYEFTFHNTPIGSFLEDMGILELPSLEINMNIMNINILMRFRRLRYLLYCRTKLKDWLWERVRLPKIKACWASQRVQERLDSCVLEEENVLDLERCIDSLEQW